jgi:type II secretory pathway component PulF
MARYRYSGFDASGARVAGVVDADSTEAARAQLDTRGLMLSELAAESSGSWLDSLGMRGQKVGFDDVEFLTAQLSVLLDSGVRIDRAVAILQRSGRSPAVQRLLSALGTDLKQGKQLSEAAAAHPEVFDPLFVNLVALGESSGRLPDVFRGLADDLKFRREMRDKALQAATYPLVVLGVCILAVMFILNYVVPNLTGLFADAQALPWYTTALLATSAFARSYQWFVIIALAFAGAWVWQSRKKPWVIDMGNRIALDWPGIRDATEVMERIRFASGLGMMLDAGLPVDRALRLAAGNLKQLPLRQEMSIAIERVRRGEQLSVALRQTRLFPDFYASLVEVGEESGQLARVFLEISRRSRDAFAQLAQRLATVLEPALILIMGIIVGGVVVIMMLSITSVTDVNL